MTNTIDDRIEKKPIMRVDLRYLPTGWNVLAFTQDEQYRFEMLDRIGNGEYFIAYTNITGGPFSHPTKFFYQGAAENGNPTPGIIRVGNPMIGSQVVRYKKVYCPSGEVEEHSGYVEHKSQIVRHIEIQPPNSNVTPFRRIKKVS